VDSAEKLYVSDGGKKFLAPITSFLFSDMRGT
jgi:hypothetical protein